MSNELTIDKRLDALSGIGDDNEAITITRKNLRLCAEDAEAHMQTFWINIETLRSE